MAVLQVENHQRLGIKRGAARPGHPPSIRIAVCCPCNSKRVVPSGPWVGHTANIGNTPPSDLTASCQEMRTYLRRAQGASTNGMAKKLQPSGTQAAPHPAGGWLQLKLFSITHTESLMIQLVT
jgi:hypothetical protein